MTSTYLSYLTFERNYGRPLGPVDTTQAETDTELLAEEAYFRANIGRVSTGAELAADDRLFRYALTAFGMTDQFENKEQIVQVLDEGIFDPFDPANKASTPTSAIDRAAQDFWFGRDLVFSFEKDAQIDETISRYIQRTGDDPLAVQDQINYFRDNIGLIASGEDLIEDIELRNFVFIAYDLTEEVGNQELVAQALDAGTYNPAAATAKDESLANTLDDSRFRTLAQAFAFNEVGDLNTQNVPFIDTVVSNYNKEALTLRAEAEQVTGRDGAPIQNFYKREIEYFRENIGKVDNAEELLADERLYRFALTAFDLESQADSRALVKKVLDEGVVDDDALANQLIDKKFRDLAAALGFAEVGDRNVRNPNFVEDTIDAFTRVKVETDAGEDNLGVRLGAYFDRKADNLSSYYDVLGDRALREVMFVALDLPDELNQTSPDKLVEIFESRMPLEDLNDPEKRGKFIERFTLLYDIRNGSPGFASNTLALYGVNPVDSSASNGVVSIDPATLGAATLF